MSSNAIEEFPLWSLLPKKETGVTAFLNKYPNYDGRGVKIAIFDSGIDPGAPGLQVTSHGLPKIIEMIDASGAGDVDTSTVVTAENGEITGLSGRKLKIPASWNNPSGNYHLGIKNICDLYPASRSGLRKRVLKTLKEKYWNGPHNIAEADVARLVQKFEKDHPNTTQLSPELRLEKEELEAQAEMLKANEKLVEVGIAYDCVVFHDGSMWRAAIDNSETGDLEQCTLLGPYSETLQYAMLTKEDNYNYSVNIYDEGNLLQIVGNTSEHGTHVASITAANFPGEPHRNGVAPGAQIVNICIGDNRLNGMETGTALTRAMIKVVELKCDVINMSYGERSHWIGGLVLERLEEMINKNGTIMVTSAGNSGPALSTIGTPAHMKRTSLITVGAYVSPEMMVASYSLRDKVPAMNYTWSSRGPTLSGEIGVTITAPGGAITSVPNWTLQNAQLMNGTSMSSPHAAGAIGVLLSGLKAKNIKYSPYSIERGLKITALQVPSYEIFCMGAGLLQVEKAFDWLVESEGYQERDVYFECSSSDSQQGIYLREAHQMIKPTVFSIKVEPLFLNEAEVEPSKKVNFNMNLNLACDASWVHAPAHLNLMYGVRNFGIKVDPTGLPSGISYTSIRAYDSKLPEKGPVFEIPITIVKPQSLADKVRHELSVSDIHLRPGQILRQFIEVPVGATWASVKVSSKDPQDAASFILHAVQMLPLRGSHVSEFDKMFSLEALGETTLAFQIKESRTLELTLAKWWASIGDIKVNMLITFHGVKPSQDEILIQPSCGIQRIDVKSTLRSEEINPSASLKSHVMVLRPTENKIVPLGSLDVIPKDRQIYELQLTYTFNIAKAAEVMPNLSYLSEFLYESEYESQLWMVFDSNKKLCLSGDACPLKNSYSTKLEKGDYTIKAHIRHEKKSLLEKLTEVLFEVVVKLSTPISLDIYYACQAAFIDGKKVTAKAISVGETVPLYITSVPTDKLPKNGTPGHYLQGTITYVKNEMGKKVDQYPIKYMIPEAPKKAASPKPTDKEKTVDEECAEAIRDVKITWIPKLKGEAADTLYKEVIDQHTDNIQVILARIQFLDANKERPTEALNDIIKLCNEILRLIDLKELLAFFAAKNGKKQDPTLFKTQEKQKTAVIEALAKKGAAMCDLLERESKETKPVDTETISISDDISEPKTLAEINELFAELQKWADPYDPKVGQFVEKHARAHKQYGRALKAVVKLLEEKPTIELERTCIELYEKLGWNYCVKWAENALPVKYPPSYTLF